MFAGGLILSLTCMAFAVWLQRTESIGWPAETRRDQADEAYLRRRGRARLRVNVLFFLCGVLILVATLATPARGAIWAACWLSVTVVLMTVVFLAVLDIWRTLRHQRRKLDDLKRRS